jgi:hypothetical protein
MGTDEQNDSSQSRSGDAEPAELPSSPEPDAEHKRRLLTRVAAMFRERRRHGRERRAPDTDDESGDQV